VNSLLQVLAKLFAIVDGFAGVLESDGRNRRCLTSEADVDVIESDVDAQVTDDFLRRESAVRAGDLLVGHVPIGAHGPHCKNKTRQTRLALIDVQWNCVEEQCVFVFAQRCRAS